MVKKLKSYKPKTIYKTTKSGRKVSFGKIIKYEAKLENYTEKQDAEKKANKIRMKYKS